MIGGLDKELPAIEKLVLALTVIAFVATRRL
jgi:hypothetical protein